MFNWDNTQNLVNLYQALLLGYLDEIRIYISIPEFQAPSKITPYSIDEFVYLGQIFDKFHSVANQLNNRKKGKRPFVIDDETDVQDLLHALMTPVFEDIRIDEPTPSYAGKFAKMDFTIKEKQIVIETKIASPSHLEDKISDELIPDIIRYKERKDYNILICFIYDPEFKLKKAPSLKNDLEKMSTPGLAVEVVIEPKR